MKTWKKKRVMEMVGARQRYRVWKTESERERGRRRELEREREWVEKKDIEL